MAKKAERLQLLPPGALPFGVDRVQAAALIGIGETLFDQCVAAGTLPQPRVIGGRNVYDVEEIYQAFKRFPHRAGPSGGYTASIESGSTNPWDDA